MNSQFMVFLKKQWRKTVMILWIALCIKVAGNHVNEIHDFRKQLNLSRLGCLCRRRFALRFACLPIDIEHGKF